MTTLQRTLVLSCLLLFITDAQAQLRRPGDKPKWELSGFAGYSMPSGQENFLTPLTDGSSKLVNADYSSGYAVGARATENMGQHFGAELEYSMSSVTMGLANLKPTLPLLEIDEFVHTFVYQGVLYLADRRQKIRPFAAAGAGASYFYTSGDSKAVGRVNGIELENQWKFAFTFGGGLKWHLGRSWGIRFDFRDNVTSVPSFGLLKTGGPQDAVFRPDGSIHNMIFSVGFLYSFDEL